jgi:hypothetical protein
MENKRYQTIRNGKSLSSLREIRQVFKDWVGRLLPKKKEVDLSAHRPQEQIPYKPSAANSDAVFIGWQTIPSGEVFPLYNVTAKNHPLYRSTVSDQTLRKQNLKIPQTPHFPGNEKRFDDEK